MAEIGHRYFLEKPLADSTCMACEVKFKKKPHTKGLYCSIKCVGRSRREIVKCKVCDKAFHPKPATKKKCCSMACVGKYNDRRVHKPCFGCGKILIRKALRANGRSVCSMVCRRLAAQRRYMEVRQYLDKYPGSSYREVMHLLGIGAGGIANAVHYA
jgi:hypothetical protein